MISDSAGLLDRIPEIEPLCEDRRIRKAVESGDPFKVYRALAFARWTGRLKAHRDVLQMLLRNRRLFARPLKDSSLALFTMNGFGTTLLGKAEPDAHDGSHIATHQVVAFFVLPLFPLGAYVVQQGESRGLKRSWRILARVPMGHLAFAYSRGIALLVLALVGMGALAAFKSTRYHDVYVLNGFDQPLKVELGVKSQSVPAGGRVLFKDVPIGAQHGKATSEKGAVIDQVELAVESGSDFLAWNIAGAAPLFRAEFIYYPKDTKPGSRPPDPEPTLFCGRRQVKLKDVDHLFTEPPKEISLDEKETRHTVTVIGPTGVIERGPFRCFNQLESEGRTQEAMAFVRPMLELSNWTPEATALAQRALFSLPSEAGMKLARELKSRTPNDLEAHRLYQYLLERAGEFDRLRAEYKERAGLEPESADSQYLYNRTLPLRASREAAESLVKKFPEHIASWRTLFYFRYCAGDLERADQAWTHIYNQSPEEAFKLLEDEATALHLLGRRERLETLIGQAFRVGSSEAKHAAASLHALLLLQAGKPDAADWLEALEKDTGERFSLERARAGLRSEDDGSMAYVRFLDAIVKDPAQALAEGQKLGATEVVLLPDAAWALGYGEAVRRGVKPAVARLEVGNLIDPESLSRLTRYVRGEDVTLEDTLLTPPVRSAAYFIRSRRDDLAPGQRERLLEQARRADSLDGLVARAIKSWKT